MSAQKIETSHQEQVHDVSLDYYGKRLATASSDSTVKIHSIATSSSPSQLLATLTGHTGPVWRVSWAHPKFGSILASCGFDGKVIIWKETSPDSNHWTQLQVFSEHKSSVNSVSFAPYELGLCLASGSSDGSVLVFSYGSSGTWETSKIERAHPVGVTAVSWAPAVSPGAFSGEFVRKIVSGGFDSCVRVWEMTGGVWQLESVNITQVHNDWVRDVAWAPALGSPKATIASCSQDGTLAIWTKGGEKENWKSRIVKEFGVSVWRVSWGLTGTMLSVSDGEGNVMLWKEGQNGQWEQVTKVEV